MHIPIYEVVELDVEHIDIKALAPTTQVTDLHTRLAALNAHSTAWGAA